VEEYFDARARLSAGKRMEALEILERIAERAGPRRGTLNGTSFEGFQDADPLLFPFFEVFVHDRYVWIPIGSIRELKMPPPAGLLDLLWASARVAAHGGVHIGCYLPALYPGSCRHDDDRVKMGRSTDWIPGEGGLDRGAGQHMFVAGEEEIALLDVRELAFDIPQAGDSDGTDD
jgi:type VI secretion system protein ImpE